MNEVEHGRSKLISNYGGVGSIIDTTDNSIIIETFDNWGYSNLSPEDLAKFILKDDRLLQRLRNRFPRLRHLVAVPTNEQSTNQFRTQDINPKANYFPKWFYCPKPGCERFDTYDNWLKRWRDEGNYIREFYPPKCNKCKDSVLEQVRFVLTCKNGHIHDLPWEFWNNRLPDDSQAPQDSKDNNIDEQEEKKSSSIRLNYSGLCCPNQDLRYQVSGENTELSGIWIECKSCEEKENLSGVFSYTKRCNGFKHWSGRINGNYDKDKCEEPLSVKIKTSNSVYYSNTISSLFIPDLQNPLSNDIRVIIDRQLERGKAHGDIVDGVSDMFEINKELLEQYIDTGDIKYIPDNVYRQAEYDYFLRGEQPDNNEIRFEVLNCSDEIERFSKLVRIDKLKKTTVQTSFTRNEPIDVDSILIKDGDNVEYGYEVMRQSVSRNNFETKILPAIESYGEGILFVMDNDWLKEWESKEEVIERVEKIKTNAENADWKAHEIIAKTLTPRKVLIHTLSHLLMRELEYVSGYPMSSLSERLYVGDDMHGFLISAFDGTHGYLGGLSNLGNDLDNMNRIIRSAIMRATDCSSDPICMDSEGQGVSQLNLAACHSCTLVPETTCELSNLYLDRALLVSKDFGFFKDLIKEQNRR